MERQKIVLIGAGSAMFTQGLVADLVATGCSWTLGVVDIDAQALETAAGMSVRMAQARHADIVIEQSTDRRDVLPGADIVVTTIGVGGRRAWEADVFIPRRYGIFQPVGDTVMPGGISRAMRMVPAMAAIARDVQALCPNAFFANYANPMTVNCWAVRQVTGANMVGLCHGVMHVERDLARFVGAPPEEVTSLAVGLNHLTWVYDLRQRGRDLWPVVRSRIAEVGGLPQRDANPFSCTLFADNGAYPAVHDRHVTEFFPQCFPGGRYGDMTLGVDVFSFERVIAQGDAIYERMRAQAVGEAPLDDSLFQRAAGEHEQLLDILRSMQRDERRIFSANLPNRGAVPNLPADAILELPAVATATGFRAMQILDFPEPLAALLRPKIESQRLTVQAALNGDRRLLVEALLADGALNERALAERLADDLLRQHRRYLPQFA
jgi:alpha-galactosidase